MNTELETLPVVGNNSLSGRVTPLSVTETFEKFLRLSVANGDASPTTIKSYRSGLSLYLAWCVSSGIDPRAASYENIQEYRAWVSKTYKRSTAANRLGIVRLLYRALQRLGQRPDNPGDGVKAAKDHTDQADKVLRKALTAVETAALFFHQRAYSGTITGSRNYAMLVLMVYQGLRISEVSRLMVSDLDLKSYDQLNVTGKGQRSRTLVLCATSRAALLDWMGHRGAKDGSGPLFPRLDIDKQAPLSTRAIERIADNALVLAGLKQPGRSAHALRHTFAVLAVLGGAEREALGQSLGHSSPETTAIYTRAAAQFQNNPADLVDKAINGATPF